MGSTGVDNSSQIAIEGDLLDTGNRLLAHPSSTRELLALLEKTESLLAKVWQQPPPTTRASLLPLMRALITEEIMHHTDVNVQILVASCVDELSRISAPDTPYPDKNMRVFFHLVMVAFQYLPSKSGANTSRALKIVETMAKVRSGLILLDIDEGMVFEMFQLFLTNIRPCHPRDIFKYMEMIMSLVIQESYEISIELLKPLLDSVKKGNERSLPISFNLAKKVFQNCATTVQPFLKEAIEEKKLDPQDYDEIITSLVSDTSNAESMVPNVVTQTAGDGLLQLEAKHKCCAGPSGEDGTKVVSETSQETLNGSQQPVKSVADTDPPRRKRGRKPNSVMRPEEGYQHTLSLGGKNAAEVSSGHKNQRKKALASPSQVGEKSMLADPSEKNESLKVVRQGKRKKDLALPSQIEEISMRADTSEKNESPKVISKGRKKKDLALPSQVREISMLADPSEKNETPKVVRQGKRKKDLGLPSQVGEISMPADPSKKNETPKVVSQGKRKKDLASPSQVGDTSMVADPSEKNGTPKVVGQGKRKKDLALLSQVGEISRPADPAEKNESPKVVSQAKRGRPRKKGNIVSEQNDQVKLKREETEAAKSKSSEKEKEKKSGEACVDYGEEMVNQRVQVWWPMDATYYTGTITEYDPAINKHTVLYDDDEIEVLNLKTEEWKPFSDEQLYQGRQAKQPSPAEETLETEEKRIRRKSVSSKNQMTSSSKRSKIETNSNVAGVNSETDEQNDEARRKSVSQSQKDGQKDAGGSHASKEDSAH